MSQGAARTAEDVGASEQRLLEENSNELVEGPDYGEAGPIAVVICRSDKVCNPTCCNDLIIQNKYTI